MEKEILKTIKYFSFFNYAPTFEEIYTFLGKKTAREALGEELRRLSDPTSSSESSRGLRGASIILTIIKHKDNLIRYTLPQYSKKQIQNSKFKIQNSLDKLENWKFKIYIKLLSIFPQIRLVGLSGSISMFNAQKNDDIDLFIITAKNRLFTARFIALFFAQILGLRRERNVVLSSKLQVLSSKLQVLSSKKWLTCPQCFAKRCRRVATWQRVKNFILRVTCYVLRVTSDKVCLNLFFDESNLEVPTFKKTSYVAHEILQMKPIINKDQVYEKFLIANKWVLEYFPNSARLISNIKYQNAKLHLKNQNYFLFLQCIFDILFLIFNFFSNLVEKINKKFQLQFINKHRTNELITDTQLWFHPDDFGKKISDI